MRNELIEALKAERIFNNANEPFINTLNEIVKTFSENTEIVVIESNISIIECKFCDNNSYIIWDETYWKHYYRYLAILSHEQTYTKNNIVSERIFYTDQLFWLKSIFTSLLANKFDKYISIADVLYNDLITSTFDMFESVFYIEENNEEHKTIQIPFEISKLLALYHELFHILEKNDAKFAEQNKTFVKNIIKTHLEKHINTFYKSELTKEKKLSLFTYINDIINGKNDFLRELTADYFSYCKVLNYCIKKYGYSKKVFSNFINTYYIYLEFNWQKNLVFDYWNLFYFNILTNIYSYSDSIYKKLKKGYFVADYKDTLSLPHIERKTINLSDDDNLKLKQTDLSNLLRFGIFNSLLYHLTYFNDDNTDEDIIDYEIKMNLSLSNMSAENLLISLLDNEYVSSRIIKAIDQSKNNNELNSFFKLEFFERIKSWKLL